MRLEGKIPQTKQIYRLSSELYHLKWTNNSPECRNLRKRGLARPCSLFGSRATLKRSRRARRRRTGRERRSTQTGSAEETRPARSDACEHQKVTQRARAEATLTHGLKCLTEGQQSITANEAGGFLQNPRGP